MIGFRGRTNRWKITDWWDTNRPKGRNNIHYTNIIAPHPQSPYPPLFLHPPIIEFSCTWAVSHLLQFLWLAPTPNILNIIATNIMLPPVKINIIQKHIISKGNPPPENQQDQQLSQYKKNGKSKPSSDSSNFLILTAVLWPLLIKKRILC